MKKTICVCLGLALAWSHCAQGANKKSTVQPRAVRSAPAATRHYTAPQRNFQPRAMQHNFQRNTTQRNAPSYNNVRQGPNFHTQRTQDFHSLKSPNLQTQQNQNVQRLHGLNARTLPHENFRRAPTDLNRTNFHARNDRFNTNRNFTSHARGFTHIRNSREAFGSYHRYYHDRSYWRYHYNRIVLVGGGYYYWDGGYWFPAWGYDPVFVSYAYDGPIYSYDNLPPDQVIVNVQDALQDQGYYTGDVDGELGPQTRDAIAAYQRDHGLEVTAAVDEPTVQALGLS